MHAWQRDTGMASSPAALIQLLTELGSMVQKGKFSAGMPILVRVLNRVLLPTLGRPTIPTYAMQAGRSARSKACKLRDRRMQATGIEVHHHGS